MNRILFFPREDGTCKKPQKVKMKPTPRKTGERCTRSQGPAVLLVDLSQLKSPQKTPKSTRSTKGKLEAEPQEEPTETVTLSIRSSKRKVVSGNTMEVPKSLKTQTSRRTRSLAAACEENSITEDFDNGPVVAEDKTSNKLEIDGTSESLSRKAKVKTSAEKSDVSKDTSVEIVSVSNDKGHVDSLPEEDESVYVRMPVLRSSRRLASTYGTDGVTDKPVARKTRSSASVAVEVSELKSIVESLAEKVATAKESKMSPVLDSPLKVCEEKTKTPEEEPEIEVIENPEKVEVKQMAGKSKRNQNDSVLGSEDGKGRIKRPQEQKVSSADVASCQSLEHENSAEAFVVSKKSRTPKKSANIPETEENVSVEKGNEKSVEKSKKKSFDASDTVQETIICAKMNEESALEAGTKTETEMSLLAKSPTGNLSAKTTPHKSAEKPKSSNQALSEAREVREEEIISFISSCRQGLTKSSPEKTVSEEIKLPDPAYEIMEIDDSEFVQTERPAEESSDVILLLDDSNEETEILKFSKTKLESPKKPNKNIEKSASSKLLQKTEVLLFDTLESSPDRAVLENLSQGATDKVSGLETPKMVMGTGESLKTPKSTRKEGNSAEETKLTKTPKSVKKEKRLTPLGTQKDVFLASDEDSVEELECKQVSESVNSEEAKTPKETSKKLKSKTPSVESSAEEMNLKKSPKSVKSNKENILTPKSQRDTFLETEDSEDKQVSESVNFEEAKPSKTPKKTPQKLKMPFVEDEISEKLICDQEPECLESSLVEAVVTPGHKESRDAVTGVVIEGSEQPIDVSTIKKLSQSPKKSAKKANLEPDLFELVSFHVPEESTEIQVIEEQVSETLTDRKLPDLEDETNCDSFPVFTKVKSPKAAPKETSLTGEVNRSSLLINGRMGDKLDIKNDNKATDLSDISFVPISKEILKKEKSPIISWIKKLQMNPPTVMNLESKRSKRSENKISTKTSGVSDQQPKAVLKSVKKLLESDTSEDEYLRKLELKKLIKKLKEKAARDTLGGKKSSEIEDKPKKKSKKNKGTVEVTDETETVDEIVEEQVKCNRKMKKRAIAALELTEETVPEVHEEQVKRDKKKKEKSREASKLTEKTGSKKRKVVEHSENIESSKVKKSKKDRSMAVEDDIEVENVHEVDEKKVKRDKRKKTMEASELMEGTVEEVHQGQVKRNKKKKKKSKKTSESTEKTGSTKRKLDEDSENVESSKVKKSKKVQSVAAAAEVKKPGIIITSSIPPSADSIEIQDLFLEEGIQLVCLRKRNNKDEIVIGDANQVGTAVSLLSTKYFGGTVRIDKKLPNLEHDGITDDDGLRFSQMYINRIPPHATEADILSLFPKALRCDLPKVKDADVNKGFCYLTFPDKTTTLEHVALNGQVNLFGYKLGLYARQKDNKKGTYGNLLKEMLVYITDLDSVLIIEDIPSDLTMLELSALFPSVLHINKKNKSLKTENKLESYAVVICKDAEQAEGFLSKNIVFKDKKLNVIRATRQLLNIASNQTNFSFKRPAAYQHSTLIVSNLPKKTEVQHIIDAFPSSVLAKLISRSHAHVGFPTRAEMIKIYRNRKNAIKIMDQPVDIKPYKESARTFIKREEDFPRLLHVRGFPEKTKVANLQKIFKNCKITLTRTNSVPYAVVKCKTKSQAESYLAKKNLVVHGKILKLTYLNRILRQMKREAELNLM